MYNSFPAIFKKITVRVIVSALFIWGLILPFFSQTASAAGKMMAGESLFFGIYSEEDARLTPLEREARDYRQQGVEYQRVGDLDMAMAYYQKAIELDHVYTIAYNDLGIIYEAKGMLERAEESYLKAIKINPNYLSSYSNLALLYEGKRDLQKAAEYWQKRVELGPIGDPWTEKAKARLSDIRLVLDGNTVNPGEDNVLSLMNDVLIQKASRSRKKKDKTPVDDPFDQAKMSYGKEDSAAVLEEADNAGSSDLANRGVDEFLDKVQMRTLSR